MNFGHISATGGIDFIAMLQNMFSMGAVIMVVMGAAALASKIKGGVPLVTGTAVLGAVYWFDLLDKFR